MYEIDKQGLTMGMDSLITNAISNFKKGIDISNLLDEINANEAELGEWWDQNTWVNTNNPKWIHHFVNQSDFFGDPEDIEYNFDASLMDLSNDQDIVEYIQELFKSYEAGNISYQTLEVVFFDDVFIKIYNMSNHVEASYSGFSISLSDNTSDWLDRDDLIICSDGIESRSESDLVAMFKSYMSEYIKYSNMDTDSLIVNTIADFKNSRDVYKQLKIINSRHNELSSWCCNNLFIDNGRPSAEQHRVVGKTELFGDLYALADTLENVEVFLNNNQEILNYIKQRLNIISSNSKESITIIVIPYEDLYIRIFRGVNETISFNYEVEYFLFSLSFSRNINDLLGYDDIIITNQNNTNYDDSTLIDMFKTHMSKKQ